MVILALSSDAGRLSALCGALREAFPFCSVAAFQDPLLAIQYAAGRTVNAIVTEPALKVMSGISLIRILRKRYPGVFTVLLMDPSGCTEDMPDYLVDAFVTPPAGADSLRAALDGTLDND